MFNRNPNQRLSKRRTVAIMVALTILAWATQTLFHQWGYGAELGLVSPAPQGEEKFIAPNQPTRGATIELRGEASVIGQEVKLKQVCRWADADAPTLAPLADLVLIRLEPKQPFKAIGVDQIKSTLREAGVNIAAINFTGAASCTVSRADVKYDERVALQQWIDARSGKQAEETPTRAHPATQPSLDAIEHSVRAIQASLKSDPGANRPGVRTLRDALVADVAQRLDLPPESLQVDFRAQDEKILNLTDAQFKFAIEPVRVRNLGNVEWAVTISADANTIDDKNGGQQRVKVNASARAWQDQVVLARPLAFKQIIRDEDLSEKRILVDVKSDDALVTRSQTVGQQAARELKSGTVLTARMIDPIQLVKTGQYVTISVTNGGVTVKTVAKALEPGSFGQTIKVKNETTKEQFDVTVTGAQTASLNSPPAGSDAVTATDK